MINFIFEIGIRRIDILSGKLSRLISKGVKFLTQACYKEGCLDFVWIFSASFVKGEGGVDCKSAVGNWDIRHSARSPSSPIAESFWDLLRRGKALLHFAF